MESKNIVYGGGFLLSFFMLCFGILGIVKSIQLGDNLKLTRCIVGSLIFLAFVIIGFLKFFKKF